MDLPRVRPWVFVMCWTEEKLKEQETEQRWFHSFSGTCYFHGFSCLNKLQLFFFCFFT